MRRARPIVCRFIASEKCIKTASAFGIARRTQNEKPFRLSIDRGAIFVACRAVSLAIRSYFHGSAVRADLSSTGQFAQGSASMPASRESFPDRRAFRSFAKRFLLLPV